MQKLHHLIICIVSAFSLLIVQKAGCQNYIDSIDLVLQNVQETGGFPGFSISVVNQEGILYSKGFGYADLEHKKAYTDETLLNIGSVSKTFIGLAVAQLVEEGKLSLDTKINEVLPYTISHPAFKGTPITIRHLVSHTSGISDSKIYNKKCYVLTEDLPKRKKGFSFIERIYLRILKKNKLMPLEDFLQSYLIKGGKFYKKKNFNEHQPGQQYEYSNVASALCAAVVSHVTGMDYREYVKKHILTPLKMDASGWTFDDIQMDKHASLYSKNNRVFPKYTLVTFPDGGLLSSSSDLASYLQEHIKALNGQSEVISQNAIKTLLTTLHVDEGEGVALFWSMDEDGQIGHNGGDPGIFTMVRIFPESNLAMAFTSNKLISDGKTLVQDFTRIWRATRKYGHLLNNTPYD